MEVGRLELPFAACKAAVLPLDETPKQWSNPDSNRNFDLAKVATCLWSIAPCAGNRESQASLARNTMVSLVTGGGA